MRTRGTEWMLILSGLSALLLGGCGGGATEDFGPTRKAGSPSVSKAAGSKSRDGEGDKPAAMNTAAQAKLADTETVKTSNTSEDALSPSKESPADAPIVANAVAKADASETASQPVAKVDPKTAAAAGVLPDKVTRKPSREDDDAPAPAAKPATPVVADKVNVEKKLSTAASAPQDAPEVTRQELSPELREWLTAKRRQASINDGHIIITAVDLSRVSIHDLHTGQLAHEFFGPSGHTTGLGISPKRNWVIGATDAGWVRLWTIDSQTGWDRFARETMREAQVSLPGVETEQNGVWAVATSPKSEWFIAGGDDGSLRRCDVVPASTEQVEDAISINQAPRLTLKLGDKIEAHAGAVTDLEISADGEWIVSGGSDQRVRLWSTSAREATRTWTDMPAQITGVGISSNGKIVAASGLDKFARWWSAEALESVPVPEKDAKPAKPEAKPASPAAKPANLSADAKKVAAKDAKPKNGLEHPDIVLAVAVSADGQFVATGCKDKLVRVWNLSTGQTIEKYEGAKDAIVEVRFVDRDKRLLFRDRSGVVRSRPRVRNVQNDDDGPPPPTEQPTQFVTPAALLTANTATIPVIGEDVVSPEMVTLQKALRNASSRDARALARQELLKAMNLETEDSAAEKTAHIASLEKELAAAKSDAIKADLKRQISRLKTVVVSQERTERPKLNGTLSNTFSFSSPPANHNHSTPSAVQLAIQGDGELLTIATTQVAGHNEGDKQRHQENPSARLWAWDIATQTPLRQWDDLQFGLESTCFVDSLGQFVSPSGRVFSLSNGQSLSLGDMTIEPISALAVAPNGKQFAVGHIGSAQTAANVLRLVDADTLQEVKVREAFEGLVTAVTFAPDGESLAVAVRERQLHRLLMLDTSTFAVLTTVEETPHSTPWLQGGLSVAQDRGLTTLLFSSDGRYLLTNGSYAAGDYRLTLWQKKSGKWVKESAVNTKSNQPIIADAHPPAPIWFVSGKGNQLAAITAKGLGIVDVSSGRLIRSLELRDSQKERGPVAWSADGIWFAQGDETGHVTLWNLRVEREAAIFSAQLGPVKALALSHDGRVMATLGEENKLHLWNLEGWQPKNRIAAKPKTAKPATTAE